MQKSSILTVLANRNFRNLWLGQIISQVALNMLSFVLATRVYQLTGSNTAVSLMLLSFGVPAIIFGVLAGGIVDYFDKRNVLIFCNLSRVLLLFFFFFFARNIFFLYVLSIFISIITQLFIPAEAPSIPILVGEEQILTANSLFTVSFYLATLSGFILAGPMIRIFNYRNVYLFMAVLMALASFFVSRLPSLGRKNKYAFLPDLKFVSESIREGLSFIIDNKRIGESLILMTVSQALIATLSVLAPGFAVKILNLDLTDASYTVIGPAALGLVLGSLYLGEFGWKFLKGSIILAGILATGISLIFLASITFLTKPLLVFPFFQSQIVINNLVLAIFFLVTLGISNSFISVPANVILQEESNNRVRGRVYGVLTSLTGGVSILPIILSGILADLFGIGITLFVIGVFVILIGSFQYLRRKGLIEIASHL